MGSSKSRHQSPTLKFIDWFYAPLQQLKTLPEDRGAFAAMMISLALYERFATASLKAAGESANKEGLFRQLSGDFGISVNEAKLFWETVRDGFLHQGMPLQGSRSRRAYPKWLMTSGLDEAISFRKLNDATAIVFHPWKFSDDVIDLYRKNPHLFSRSTSFPLASFIENAVFDE